MLTSSAADGDDTQKLRHQQPIDSHAVTSATAGFITASDHLMKTISAHGKVQSATADNRLNCVDLARRQIIVHMIER